MTGLLSINAGGSGNRRPTTIAAILQADRRELVNVRKVQRQRQADEQHQAHQLLDPVRQADHRMQVMKELDDQPT
jgi:hypothetical protein